MPRLRVLSGKKILGLLVETGFVVSRIRGSHVIFLAPDKETEIVVPLHKEIDRGTLNSIIKMVSPFLTSDFIKTNFYR